MLLASARLGPTLHEQPRAVTAVSCNSEVLASAAAGAVPSLVASLAHVQLLAGQPNGRLGLLLLLFGLLGVPGLLLLGLLLFCRFVVGAVVGVVAGPVAGIAAGVVTGLVAGVAARVVAWAPVGVVVGFLAEILGVPVGVAGAAALVAGIIN
jgi:hypothetical protein